MKRIHLDNAAATELDPQVFRAMLPFFSSNCANPSALYTEAVSARKAVDASRRECATVLGTTPDTIVFTASGTESANLAIFGILKAAPKKSHIVTTQIEHHAVLEPIRELEKSGYKVTYLKPNHEGLITPEQVLTAITKDTALVSIMYANNEIGAIAPIAEIGRRISRLKKETGSVYPYFHTDACQAAQFLPLHVEKLHIDLLTLNASKIYGPKGAGLLYVRRGTKIQPITLGGGQEKNLRSGTENVAAIAGLGKALTIIEKNKTKNNTNVAILSKRFWLAVKKMCPNAMLNGPEFGENRLANNVSISFPGIDGETLVLYLDAAGIEVSTGSACATEADGPSHVLKAIGVSKEFASQTIRFSLSRTTSTGDLTKTVKAIVAATKKLSP